jgi:hypothetical protein
MGFAVGAVIVAMVAVGAMWTWSTRTPSAVAEEGSADDSFDYARYETLAEEQLMEDGMAKPDKMHEYRVPTEDDEYNHALFEPNTWLPRLPDVKDSPLVIGDLSFGGPRF